MEHPVVFCHRNAFDVGAIDRFLRARRLAVGYRWLSAER